MLLLVFLGLFTYDVHKIYGELHKPEVRFSKQLKCVKSENSDILIPLQLYSSLTWHAVKHVSYISSGHMGVLHMSIVSIS